MISCHWNLCGPGSCTIFPLCANLYSTNVSSLKTRQNFYDSKNIFGMNSATAMLLFYNIQKSTKINKLNGVYWIRENERGGEHFL